MRCLSQLRCPAGCFQFKAVTGAPQMVLHCSFSTCEDRRTSRETCRGTPACQLLRFADTSAGARCEAARKITAVHFTVWTVLRRPRLLDPCTNILRRHRCGWSSAPPPRCCCLRPSCRSWRSPLSESACLCHAKSHDGELAMRGRAGTGAICLASGRSLWTHSPTMVGSSSRCLRLAGMMARPRATWAAPARAIHRRCSCTNSGRHVPVQSASSPR